jgi:hypothetical protein
MKRFLIQASVLNAEGSQTWYADAETEAEALQKYNNGDCDIYASEIDITSLGEPELVGETTLDDFGDLAATPPAAQPVQRPWVGLTDDDLLQIRESVQIVEGRSPLQSLTKAIEAKLKDKNT